jgi:putative hemolysin
MKRNRYILGLTLVLSTLIISGCGAPTAQPTEIPAPTPVGLPNPASAYCEEQGYTVEMRTDASGGQYGVCVFPGGNECDEWAYYRGECGPDTGAEEVPATEQPGPAGGLPVVGWLGYVASTPGAAQFDDYVVLMPEGAGEIGIAGADEGLEAEIVALRDHAEPGKYAHFWGTLTCDVPDYGGCQLLVTRLRTGQTFTGPEPVEAWEGVIVGNPPAAQFDDYLILSGDFPVGFGLSSLDPALATQLESLRDTGITARVWGQLRTGVPDAYGSQIEVTRVEGVGEPLAPTPATEEATEAVDGWAGRIVKLPPGNQFGHYFEREDGQRFDVGSTDEAINQHIAEVRWTGAHIRVWGRLFTGVPAIEARHVEVERLEVISGPAAEPRNLTPFVTASGSSFLPTDQGGQYQPWMAVDGLLETAWVEGVAGPGTGEWLMLTFPGTIELHSVRLDVGYDRDTDVFNKNNRIKRATLIFSSGEQVQLDFSDVRGLQEIPLVRAPGPNIETTYVQVVIDEVYPGTRYDDTCLAEIEVWGKVK